jgi:tetratricopeptide (TPR) repeat protein
MVDLTSHEAAARKAQSLPVALPGKLSGRDANLAAAYGQLKNNKAVLIGGVPGIGKTALAAALASAYTELPGGALWLIVDDSSLEELIVRVGRAYGVSEITSSNNPLGMVGAAASTLTTHKPLIVLDGKHNAAASADFIRRCANGLPALVVSKDVIEGPWTPVMLDRIAPPQAAAMFKQISGLESPAEDIDKLVAMLDCVPFAIAVAAGSARANKQSPADYIAAFQNIPNSASANPQLIALTVSFRSLNNALQGVMLMMGATFAGQASAELLSLMTGAPQPNIEQVMTMLANAQLVEQITRYDAPYYRLHEITYAFAQSWLRGSGRLEQLQNKVRDALVNYSKKYSLDNDTAHNKLAAEMDTIMAVARWSADNGDRDLVNQLVVNLTQAGDFVNERGYLYELLALRKLASSFTTAFQPVLPGETAVQSLVEAAGEPLPFESSTSALAAPEDLLDDEDEDFEDDDALDEDESDDDSAINSDDDADAVEDDLPKIARLRAALRQAKADDDLEKQIDLLKEIGEEEVEQGLETEAITTYMEVLEGYESQDDQEGILESLDTLSSLMAKTENASAAVLHATRGAALADEIGDLETKMHLLVTLGDARQQSGESDEAAKAYESALEIARAEDDTQNEARILYKLGYAQLDGGDPGTASDTWEQALKLFKTQGKRSYEGRVLGGLGTAYGELGRWSEAINFHTSALHIAREVKNKEDEALELSNLGYASIQANQLGQAVMRYRQALHLAYQANDRENIVSNIVDLVRMLVESPRHLDIADLLIDDALTLESTDRELSKLKERITNEKLMAKANQVTLLPVSGTAKDYAANAYQQLEL